MAPIVTRFAPSPTGFLHIGGVRTALFNWLFAKHHGGTYLLRVEDTDRKRSTPEAVNAIIQGLEWIGLEPDEAPIFQSEQQARHAEIAQQLVDEGKAYYCYCTSEELAAMREEAEKQGKPTGYNRMWRESTATPPAGIAPSVRIKAPLEGSATIADAVQGDVTTPYADMDDFVILRSDGTPTYMLSVVVDDHDMGITHIIRGDDHLTNAFRQKILYDALGWQMPICAHIPLIHGPDGAKLSKRHGALGIEAYREMGYLPEALRNYLVRLGWSHGDAELFTTEQAIAWFGLEAIGKAPSRIDFDKMQHTNAHYIQQMDDAELAMQLMPFLPGEAASKQEELTCGMAMLKTRATTLKELAKQAAFLLGPVMPEDDKSASLLKEGTPHLQALLPLLQAINPWEKEALSAQIKDYVSVHALSFAKVGMPLRVALAGSTKAPGVNDIMAALGKEETLQRLQASL